MPATDERRSPPPAESRELDLLVVGEINPDVVVRDPDPRPVFGQAEREVAEIRLTIGSSSAITACGAARLGLRVAIVGVVGDDALGRYTLEALAERGVDVGFVRTDPSAPTGASVILSGATDRAILTAYGSIGAVAVSDVPAPLLARARHLHVGSWFLQRSLWPDAGTLFRNAHDAGLTTSLDPNWDPAEHWTMSPPGVLTEVDLVMPNTLEAARISRHPEADARAAAVAVARIGHSEGADRGTLAIVKAGAQGAVAATWRGVVASTSAFPIEAVDTTGAGDSFNAGFLDGWLAAAPVDQALRRAAVCGALSTRLPGGTEAQPTRSEVERALAEWST
jgi:ribokinase